MVGFVTDGSACGTVLVVVWTGRVWDVVVVVVPAVFCRRRQLSSPMEEKGGTDLVQESVNPVDTLFKSGGSLRDDTGVSIRFGLFFQSMRNLVERGLYDD